MDMQRYEGEGRHEDQSGAGRHHQQSTDDDNGVSFNSGTLTEVSGNTN